MRISDWSSDVCSSDLTATTLAYAHPIADWLLGASLRHVYMGQACNTIECTARQFDYHTIDLNIFASGPEGSWWPQLSVRSEEHTSELQSLMRISYAVFCLKKKKK